MPCSGANFCCPPNSLCYVDNFNVARCSPKGATPSPTPTPSPRYSSSSTITITSFTRSSTSFSTISRLQPTPIPFNSNESGSGSGSSSSRSREDCGFWTPAAIGGVAGGSTVALILLLLIICYCIRKSHYGSGSGNYGWAGPWTGPRMPSPIKPLSDHQIAALVVYRDNT